MTTTATTFPPHIQAIVDALERRDYLRDPEFDAAPAHISQTCRGWSSPSHYAFFASILDAAPWADSWLILGVYEGRDIAFIRDHSKRQHPERAGALLQITGVDLFSDGPCNDWPEETRGKTWEEAGMGPAPTLGRAQSNLAALHLSQGVTLIRGNDEAVLDELARGPVVDKFDVIYIDTSHDYATVARQLRQIVPLCHERTIICGDDYQPRETWDVRRAVMEVHPQHVVFGGTIWLAATPATAAHKAPQETVAL